MTTGGDNQYLKIWSYCILIQQKQEIHCVKTKMSFKTIFDSPSIEMKFIIAWSICVILKLQLTTNIQNQTKIASKLEMTKHFHKALIKDLKAQK